MRTKTITKAKFQIPASYEHPKKVFEIEFQFIRRLCVVS